MRSSIHSPSLDSDLPTATALEILSRHKARAVAACAAGIAAGCGAKYIGAALLVLWLLAGGQ